MGEKQRHLLLHHLARQFLYDEIQNRQGLNIHRVYQKQQHLLMGVLQVVQVVAQLSRIYPILYYQQ
jgi:hypothetical protein